MLYNLYVVKFLLHWLYEVLYWIFKRWKVQRAEATTVEYEPELKKALCLLRIVNLEYLIKTRYACCYDVLLGLEQLKEQVVPVEHLFP